MVDISTDRCNLMISRFFRHAVGQAGRFILKAVAPMPHLPLHTTISTSFLE